MSEEPFVAFDLSKSENCAKKVAKKAGSKYRLRWFWFMEHTA